MPDKLLRRANSLIIKSHGRSHLIHAEACVHFPPRLVLSELSLAMPEIRVKKGSED